MTEFHVHQLLTVHQISICLVSEQGILFDSILTHKLKEKPHKLQASREMFHHFSVNFKTNTNILEYNNTNLKIKTIFYIMYLVL